MGRPSDWSPVDRSEDPTPGDPYEVADLAARYRRTAEAIRKAADGLQKIGASSYKGKGGDALRQQAVELRSDLMKADDRYADTARALADYHPELNAAQIAADAALSRAQQAKALEGSCLRQLEHMDREVPPAEESPAAAQVRAAARAAVVRDLNRARATLAEAKSAVTAAEGRQDSAAETAARLIHDVNEHSAVKDSWKDDLGGVMKVVADIAGTIAAVCGVLALAVGWIPVIGQALAAVLGTVALVASIVSLLANLTLMAVGKGSLKAVLLDALSVATFGVARVFSAAGRLSATAVRGRAWQVAGQLRNAGIVNGRLRVLIGGRLHGATAAIPLAGTRWFRPGQGPVGTLRPGAVLGDFGAGLTGVRAGWRTLPASTSAYVAQARTTFGAAHAAAGRSGVLHAAFGNADAVTDLQRLSRIHPEVARQADVQRLVRQAYVQPLVSTGASAVGSTTDVYQAAVQDGGGLLGDAGRGIGLLPDTRVDAVAAGGGRSATSLPDGFVPPSRDLAPPGAGPR